MCITKTLLFSRWNKSDARNISMEFFTNAFTTTRWRDDRRSTAKANLPFMFICFCLFVKIVSCDQDSRNKKIEEQYCKVSIEFRNKLGDVGRENFKENGRYGHLSKVNYDGPLKGQLVHVKTLHDKSDLGCGEIDPAVVPASGTWVALVRRGICSFNEKIYFAAKRSNASAVIVYSHKKEDEKELQIIKTTGKYNVSNVISIFIQHEMGRSLVEHLQSGHKINITITRTNPEASSTTTTAPNQQFAASNTSVLFVSISFIVLIIISLAWLVFYYIQRCRYTNAKERLSRRLANAAKKAIAKIPQRSVKYGDKELECDADQCAVCIEPYKVSDVIRILPCKHVFHKSCVDPWLLDQRTCPMCKMDILRAFGMQLNWSQESVPQEADSGMMNSSPAIEEAEHLSTSDEQGAVGGVKIVLYQHPAVHYGEGSSRQFHDLHYSNCGTGQFHDSEGSSDSSLHLCSSPVAQCHVECTSQIVVENSKKDSLSSAIVEPGLAMSVSLDSLHITDDEECNENQSLIQGVTQKGDTASVGTASSKSLRRGSASGGSITSSIKQISERDSV